MRKWRRYRLQCGNTNTSAFADAKSMTARTAKNGIEIPNMVRGRWSARECPTRRAGVAIGWSFAVLVTKEMFASGCELLVSVTSSRHSAGRRPNPGTSDLK